jgi:hypothetical protein
MTNRDLLAISAGPARGLGREPVPVSGIPCPAESPEPSARRRPTVFGMVSAWLFVTLAGLAALACGAGAYRLARRPKGGRR